MIECHSLKHGDLERFLERQKASVTLRSEFDLDLILKQILQKAYEFVPSESGSILLDDPFRKSGTRKDNDLVFIATFGTGSDGLLGERLSASKGIAGRVYQTGAPYVSQNVDHDQYFFKDIDMSTGFKTNSLVCVPIYIGKTVCGVLELMNRTDGQSYTLRDMTLLEIFAGYTSFMLQNALDAKRAHELAKRDDLTGLFNDRWFHVCLNDSIAESVESGNECVLLFMDLDHFKTVNDQHGHLAGSQVLREVGFILKRVIDGEAAVVSRYGGDEFVAILPNTHLEEGLGIAERVRKTIEQTTFLERDYGFGSPAVNLEGLITASIGLATFTPRAGLGTLEILRNDFLRRADAAMYEAKSKGKNRVIVDPSSLGLSTIQPAKKQLNLS